MRKLQHGSFPWAVVLHELHQRGTFPHSQSGTDCSGMESSMGCRCISAPVWSSMGCRETTCFTMVFSTGCRGIPALVPGAPPPPPCSLPGAFLSHFSHFSLPQLLRRAFYPMCIVTEATPVLVVGSALGRSGSVLGLVGSDCLHHGSSSWCLLAEDTLAAPCHRHLTT